MLFLTQGGGLYRSEVATVMEFEYLLTVEEQTRFGVLSAQTHIWSCY